MEMDERKQLNIDLTPYPEIWKGLNEMVAEAQDKQVTRLTRPAFVLDMIAKKLQRYEAKKARQAEGKK